MAILGRAAVRQACYCGSQSFAVAQETGPKGRFVLICEGCECRRRVVTPGIAADRYEVTVPFADPDSKECLE